MNMEPQLFAVELKKDIDDKCFSFLYHFIDEEKRLRIDGMKIKKDKDLMLVGGILARYAVNKVFGIPFSEIRFAAGKHGKPFVSGYPNVHFNISHSGSMVVCAVCDEPVGVDIQRMNHAGYEAVAKRFFTESEQRIFFSADEEFQKEQFFRLWTAKESYIKFLGTGLRDLRREIPKELLVDTFSLAPGYMVSVCSKILDNNSGEIRQKKEYKRLKNP